MEGEMKIFRKIRWSGKSKATMEGAGVRLNRAFGYREQGLFDPFLMFDDFRSNHPADYMAGFPWHPHRGIETVTYMLEGSVRHEDSTGNKGLIQSGDIQWMTAGSGIIHSEMPESTHGISGFQLWVNLPAKDKMMAPRYQDIKKSAIPVVELSSGIRIRVAAGTIEGIVGPVRDIMASPEFLDVTIPPNQEWVHEVVALNTAAAYVVDGEAQFSPEEAEFFGDRSVILFDKGPSVKVRAGDKGVRFIFLSGAPINEPIAWNGPIVMNTEAELAVAFEEYQRGTFLKHK